MRQCLVFVVLCLVSVLALAENADFQLVSPAFIDGGVIPIEYSSQGTNTSPALMWANPPQGTRSYVLMMIDFDAERTVGFPVLHWLAYNLKPSQNSLPKGVKGLNEGLNGYGLLGYIGMNPPFGEKHRYTFRLFALSLESLKVPQNASVQQVLMAMNHHIINEAHISGYYQRPSLVPQLNNIYLESP